MMQSCIFSIITPVWWSHDPPEITFCWFAAQ